MITNPYMDALKSVHKEFGQFQRFPQYKSFSYNRRDFTDHRGDLVKEYAWAIPSNEALRKIADFAHRICEIGAGTGYWAYMLKQHGVDIVAYDLAVPGVHDNQWGHQKTWFDVKHGDVLSINQHQDRALMLCWPPYSKDMASSVLKLYSGIKVIYIGEGEYGCTANEEFFELLDKQFNEISNVEIPQWDGLHDCLYLYERK